MAGEFGIDNYNRKKYAHIIEKSQYSVYLSVLSLFKRQSYLHFPLLLK
jgi:hypothetical protein